ncbi:MAG: site-2 protease family protein [Clostridia bacterium]|nr:site-2 protease family protein [Clostridia bacterium]
MITAVVTIIMFLVMVSLHEFGHFIVGKLLGFKILEYAIGFGPQLLKKQGTETMYSLRAIPVGGYCKFEGEDGDSDDDRAFSKQAVWKRILVVLAGGVSNIILGFVLFMIIVPMTSPILTNTVESVVKNSYVETAGLMPGDKIVEIDNKKVSFYNDISLATEMFTKDTNTTIKVYRNGEKLTLTFKPTEEIINYKYEENGVTVEETINGVKTTEFYEYGKDNVRDDSKVGTEESITRYIIGFRPHTEPVTVFNVWQQAWFQTKFVVKIVYQSLWQMVTGKVGMDQVSGPVGIVSEVNNAVNSGSRSWLYVLNLVALLTINLGVFNLLPVPALDGGRLFFMVIELIRQKPIPPEKEGMVHAIGMLMLFGLIIVISFNDIMKLIGR